MKPMLASKGTEDLLDRKGFIFEPKLDGIRALCYKKTKLKFTSRNDLVVTNDYPEFTFFDQIEAEECILDGEIVIYDDHGKPSFSLWTQRKKGKSDRQATYVVFDILYFNGESLLNTPLYARKKIIEKIVKEGNRLQIVPFTKDGRKLLALARENGLEGIVAKKYDSSYECDARSEDWRKITFLNEVDCAVVGFTKEKRKLTSLALALFNGENFTYVGKVGTGFSEKTMDELRERLDVAILKKSSVEMEEGIIPVEPMMVVSITFKEWSTNKKLRAPVFVRVRDDKEPRECLETPQ